MKRINRNKKGNFLTDNIGSFLLALAVAMVGLYLIWAYILHGGGTGLAAAQKCGALTGSRGECKMACDANIEVEFENIGCGGKDNKCCVLKDENIRDVMLPSGYGGNNDYNFDVTAIRLAAQPGVPNGCEVEQSPTGPNDKSILCKPKLNYKITVEIDVENTGTEELTVSAVPVVVIGGNADLVKPSGTYVGKEETLPSGGGTTKVYADISISSTDSKENNYLKIYPYVKCETRRCKKSDEKSRGILDTVPTDSEEVITLKFVPITT
jgi:hypothetical protein